MDRTNWKFATTDINILVLSIPILYLMMPEFGNSSTAVRIHLVQRCIELFGVDTIDCLLGNRKFVGDQWLAYLNNKKDPVPHPEPGEFLDRHHQKQASRRRLHGSSAILSSTSMSSTAELFMPKGSFVICLPRKPKTKTVTLNSRSLPHSISPIRLTHITKNAGRSNQLLKALKISGFNIEDRYLTDPDRIEKLFALSLVAFVWANKA